MFDDGTGDFLANRVGDGVSAALHPAGRGSGVELHLLPGFALGGHGGSAVARLASRQEAHQPSAHHAMVSTVSHALNVTAGEPSRRGQRLSTAVPRQYHGSTTPVPLMATCDELGLTKIFMQTRTPQPEALITH